MQADFVLWNGDPLSTLSRAEQTWIDGRKYFDRAEVRREREAIARERAELIALALPERLQKLGQPLPKAEDKPAAAAAARTPVHADAWRHALAELAAWRPPYADSEPTNSCHVGEE